jgi:hypothetical protein
MLGMNAEAMTKYIQFVADRLLLQMGFWNTTILVIHSDFMERISSQQDQPLRRPSANMPEQVWRSKLKTTMKTTKILNM